MRFTTISSAALALSQMAMAASEVHGSSDLGNTMGPIDFLWPQGREWSADADNTAPCGSNRGPGERTIFPLKQGSVSLSIADEAYNVAFHIAVDNDPVEASDFRAQVVPTISEVDNGHQCYGLNGIPGAKAGTNATIQLQYWSSFEGENNGKDQKFYACADIMFVEAADFDIMPPCFNVTSEEFNPPTSKSGPTGNTESSSKSGGGGGGLSVAAIAGVAVGTTVGSLAIVGMVAWLMFRKRKASQADAEARAYKDVEEISR